MGKELITHQMDFLFVPDDVFADRDYYGCRSEKGELVINERRMKVLIVPECEFLPANTAEFIAEHPELPVIFVNAYPIGITGNVSAEISRADLLKKAVSSQECVRLEELADCLIKKQIREDIYTEAADTNLHQYHYRKDGRDIYLLMNASLHETVDVTYITVI